MADDKEPLDPKALLAQGEYRLASILRKVGVGRVQLIDDWLRSMRGAGTVCHRNKVTVYFPIASKEAEKQAEALRQEMTRIFQGTTSWRAQGTGCGNDDCTQIDDEPVLVIESYHSCTSDKERQGFANALRKAEQTTGQKWVGISGTDAFFGIPIKRYRQP